MHDKIDRQPGYYWVKFPGNNNWHIAEYTEDYSVMSWYLTGKEEYFVEEDFEEIDETPIVRDERT